MTGLNCGARTYACSPLWGRLATCGRLSIGLSRSVTYPRAGILSLWGGQSWLQPPFRRLPRILPLFCRKRRFRREPTSAHVNAFSILSGSLRRPRTFKGGADARLQPPIRDKLFAEHSTPVTWKLRRTEPRSSASGRWPRLKVASGSLTLAVPCGVYAKGREPTTCPIS